MGRKDEVFDACLFLLEFRIGTPKESSWAVEVFVVPDGNI